MEKEIVQNIERQSNTYSLLHTLTHILSLIKQLLNPESKILNCRTVHEKIIQKKEKQAAYQNSCLEEQL
jgi:hypothetical protein